MKPDRIIDHQNSDQTSLDMRISKNAVALREDTEKRLEQESIAVELIMPLPPQEPKRDSQMPLDNRLWRFPFIHLKKECEGI
jgi:hypothetical protein